MLIERFEIAFDHGVANDFRFSAGGVAFSNDANIHFDGGKFIGLSNFGEGVTGVGGVGFEFSDGEMVRAAKIGDGFGDACGIFVLLIGNDDFDVGEPGFVGIAVGKKIDATIASFFFDQGQSEKPADLVRLEGRLQGVEQKLDELVALLQQRIF